MDALSWTIALSGWVLSVVSTAFTIVVERRERRERGQKDKLAELVARATTESVVLGDDGLRSSPAGFSGDLPDQRLKSLLVGAAAGRQPLNKVQKLASQEGFSNHDVFRTVEILSNRGLLKYSPPITGDSIIELRV